jgi:alkyl hydroperoxide reductase subunit F
MENQKTYDLIIIGAGPAGCSAAVYAARKQLNTLLILDSWGGQSTVSEDIQNWIGTMHISGAELALNLKKHVLEYKGEKLNIQEKTLVEEITGEKNNFTIISNKGSFYGKNILIVTGSTRRKLEVKGADTFEHKGLTYCASCDGPMFSGSPVAVIGGGNAAFETAAQLLAYCPTVYLLNRTDTFRADEITINKLKENPNLHVLSSVKTTEVIGDGFVNALTYEDKDGLQVKLDVAGIFVEIGQLPSTSFAKNICELDQIGKIKIDPWTQKTNTPGIWAAGDCTNILYHQNNIASGDAVRALEDIHSDIHTK